MIEDSILAVDAARGDEAAFTELYERYVRRIYDFVYYKTHHKQTAEDIVSQTFLQALQKLRTFDSSKGNFSQWIYRIARNLVIDHYRSFHAASSIEDAWDLSSDSDVVADADTALKIQAVRAVLGTLSPDQREVVLLRLWHGYPFAEIAEIIGKTEGASKMSFTRAMNTVRKDILLAVLFLFFS